ncbi:hypothetical protein EMCRGX_G011868 [Ephydatia muelleri]
MKGSAEDVVEEVATIPKRKTSQRLLRRKKPTLDDLRKEMRMDEHLIPLPDLLARFGTSLEQGLTEEQVVELRRRDGPNAITPPKQLPEFLKFLKNLVGGFALLLWVAAIMSVVAYGIQQATANDGDVSNLFLGIVLIAVVLVTGAFTYFQEAKSARIMKSFLKLTPESTMVLREGRRRPVEVDTLVVGDIVDVTFGDRLPADIRVIKCSGFKVDNSSLTGESEPQSRSADGHHENPLESRNMAFYSTNAVEGWTCTGIVVKTGDNTAMGRIARLTGSIPAEKTTLQLEIEHFINLISIFAVAVGIIFFAIAISLGYHWLEAIVFLIGIITANVPEGLLPTLTVCLTLTAQRMKAKNCLVRKLEAVETLGSTSVICSDKTGTLTENRMTVAHMWYEGAVHDAIPHTERRKRPSSKGWDALALVVGLCSRTTFRDGEENKKIIDRICSGDASEAGLLKCYELEVGSVMECRARYPKIFEIPFNSTNKYQLSVHEQPNKDGYLLVIKGAPERILELCTCYLDNHGKEVPMDSAFTHQFNAAYTQLGNHGERVLGFAHKYLDVKLFPRDYLFDPDHAERFLDDLCYVGLVSLIDPPRAAVPRAVQVCRTAGIKVIMVTGDHPLTAKAIGRKVGIISPGVSTLDEVGEANTHEAQAIVVHGSDLAKKQDEELDEILANYPEIIFARTSPTQKLRIVEGCQRAGWVVAVTGDGVNDAPALRKANIGVAMGITGTEVAKQVSDMILLDDNFASIVTAVEEGRLLFDNLKKTVGYALTANIPELTPFLLFILANVPLPLGAIAIVLICIGTDIVPAVSLAYETAENKIMERAPRNPARDRLASHKLLFQSYAQIGMLEAVAGFFGYFVVMGQSGFLPSTLIGLRTSWDNPAVMVQDSYGQDWGYNERKQVEYTCYTIFFASIVTTQWANLIISKTRVNSVFLQGINNYFTFFALMSETCLAMVLTYCPLINNGLTFYELRLEWWFLPISFVLLILIYDEVRKLLIRRFPRTVMDREFLY